MTTTTPLRSEQRALERFEEASRLLMTKPERASRAMQILADEEMQNVSRLWRDGIEPMAFDRFCVELDGNPLFDRQAQCYEGSQVLSAGEMFSPARTRTEGVLCH